MIAAPAPHTGRTAVLRPATAIVTLFALVAALRVAMVFAFASPLPYFDEWDGVVSAMAKPLLHGRFDPASLLAVHNGHPLLWTKLISVVFLSIENGRFDNVPVCLFDQVVYALGATVLAWSAAAGLGRERVRFLFVALLVIAIPFDWENITMGWNSSYAILSFFSVATIVASTRAGTLAGLFGVVLLAGAATLSMGSGWIASAIGVAILLWRARLGEIGAARAAAVVVFLGAWIALAFAAIGTSFLHEAGDRGMQAVQLGLLGVCWLPAWLLAGRYLRGERNAFDLAIIGVCAWAFLQIVAMILARPAFRLWFPISRYMDVIAVGMLAVLASFCRLAMAARAAPNVRELTRPLLIASACAVVAVSPLAFYWQVRSAESRRAQARVIGRYLESRDPAVIDSAPAQDLAYPSRQRLRALLDDGDVRSIIADAVERSR